MQCAYAVVSRLYSHEIFKVNSFHQWMMNHQEPFKC